MQERQRRRRAEEALADVEARARIAIDAAGMGTWDLRPQEGLLLWDDRCKTLFGVPTSTEMSLEVFYAGIYPDDLHWCARQWNMPCARKAAVITAWSFGSRNPMAWSLAGC